MLYFMYILEMMGMLVYYVKDGWLFMYKDGLFELFFFNLFIRKFMNLFSCEYYNEFAVFMCVFTLEGCLVFGVMNIDSDNNFVGINIFKIGEIKWEIIYFKSFGGFFIFKINIIFLEGFVYCFGWLDWISVFDLFNRILVNYMVEYDSSFEFLFGCYFVEMKGDIFFVKMGGEKLRFFSLNRNNKGWSWEEKDKIDETLTIFGVFCGFVCSLDFLISLSNKLFLFNVFYSMIKIYFFDGEKYFMNDLGISFWDSYFKY